MANFSAVLKLGEGKNRRQIRTKIFQCGPTLMLFRTPWWEDPSPVTVSHRLPKHARKYSTNGEEHWLGVLEQG